MSQGVGLAVVVTTGAAVGEPLSLFAAFPTVAVAAVFVTRQCCLEVPEGQRWVTAGELAKNDRVGASRECQPIARRLMARGFGDLERFEVSGSVVTVIEIVDFSLALVKTAGAPGQSAVQFCIVNTHGILFSFSDSFFFFFLEEIGHCQKPCHHEVIHVRSMVAGIRA